MTDKSVWDKEVPVPARLIEYVDRGVLASECCYLPTYHMSRAFHPIQQELRSTDTSTYLLLTRPSELPPGTQIRGITPSGASYWARTAKIDATDQHGNPTPFFIKVSVPGEHMLVDPNDEHLN